MNSMSSLACTHARHQSSTNVDSPDVRRALFLRRKGERESLTRPSDAVRHEARPVVDTLRFVASHPRLSGVSYLPRIQLSRGSCLNGGRPRAFPLYFPQRVRRDAIAVSEPMSAPFPISLTISRGDRYFLARSFVRPHRSVGRSRSNRAMPRRRRVLGKSRPSRGFFVLIYARRSSGHY